MIKVAVTATIFFGWVKIKAYESQYILIRHTAQ